MRAEGRPTDAARLSAVAFAGLFGALLAAVALPLCLSDILPLLDYPNHLARMALLAQIPDSATLQQFYEVAWRPVPNLAMDLLVPPLLHVMSLDMAGRLFVLATFALIAGGAAALHRVLWGSWSAWPLLAFLLLYGRILLWGFLNYLFGVGLCLAALALWLALAERPIWLRLVVGVAAAVALYFAHLMAFGLYGLLLGGWELGQVLRTRPGWRAAMVKLAVAGLPLLVPLALLMLAPSASGGAINFARPWRKLDLLFTVFDAYSRPFDIACFAIAVLALGLAYWRGWLRLAPGLGVPLGLLFVAYLLMPSQLATGSGADRRLPMVLALVLCAGSRWVGKPVPQLLYLGGAGAMLAMRLGVVAVSWQASGAVYDALLRGLDQIPPGSRIAVAFPDEAVNAATMPLLHFPVLAAARREAFVPTLFADPTQQPVLLRPDYRRLAIDLPPGRLWQAFVGGKPLDAAAQQELHRFDYVVLLDRKPFTVAATDGLHAVFRQPQFQLYRLGGPPP